MSTPKSVPLDAVLKTVQGRHGVFSYLPEDIYVGRSLELYGEFSEAEVVLFHKLMNPGDVVVEAGANIGALTVPIARRVGAGGRVIAFEPQRVIAAVLVRNVLANGLGNVEVRRAGLGATPGTSTVRRIDYQVRGNFGGIALGGDGDDVPIETIDGLALPRVDFIKIDVEGMETEVLDGARATIARCRPILYVENDRDDNAKRLLATLFGFSYQLWWFAPQLFNPNNFAGRADNVFGAVESTNLICLPREWGTTPVGVEPVIDENDTREALRRRVRSRHGIPEA